MDLKEIRNKANMMLANFVNEIGLDGEYYASNGSCPMTWDDIIIGAPGKYAAPGSKTAKRIQKRPGLTENQIKAIQQRGIILVNNKYKQKEVDDDLYVTLIHETLHSKRNLLLYDAVRTDEKNKTTNSYAYTYNNGRFEQNTDKMDFSYADASQEILKGNIDTSINTISSDQYKDKSCKELEKIDEQTGNKEDQLSNQFFVDEALVELMGILANKLYNAKERGIKTDVWREIEEIKENYEGEDIVAMCKIILRHHDFELFYWMLDPITYSAGDIHYDFFGEYTKQDKDLLKDLYDSGSDINSIDDEEIDNIAKQQIQEDEIKKVATRPESLMGLLASFKAVKEAKQPDREEPEI